MWRFRVLKQSKLQKHKLVGTITWCSWSTSLMDQINRLKKKHITTHKLKFDLGSLILLTHTNFLVLLMKILSYILKEMFSKWLMPVHARFIKHALCITNPINMSIPFTFQVSLVSELEFLLPLALNLKHIQLKFPKLIHFKRIKVTMVLINEWVPESLYSSERFHGITNL